MNINASIIDQRVSGIVEAHPEFLPAGGDINMHKSAAFVLLCMQTCLDMPLEDAGDLLTEGGNDAGVDGIHISEVEDGEFLVTLFQGKYKVHDLSGEAYFPENGVEKAVNTVKVLFDPARQVNLNPRIAPVIEEARSLIRDAFIPNVRVVLCNNGARWQPQADHWIEAAKHDFGDKVSFVHVNHDNIVGMLQRSKPVDTALRMSGQAIVEDMNYMRVLIGRVAVQEIQKLFNDFGDRLLERNIRRYLGLHSNRVNLAIHETLRDAEKSDKFYFFNNGITVICDKFDYNAFQKSDYTVQIKNMQIINGGQTCKTIQETLNEDVLSNAIESAYVMVRVYQLSESSKGFIQDITYATNSQNPVDLRDLRSNDPLQKKLALGFEGLGYTYKRQQEAGSTGGKVMSSLVVAEAVLAIWRKKPHHAKFRRKDHFGKLYDEIFSNLSAAQAIMAVLIFRAVEQLRKEANGNLEIAFLPYASHYIAMLIGRKLLEDNALALTGLSHRNFQQILDQFQDQKQAYHAHAIQQLEQALKACYGDRKISLQQLSATFRRGDLLEMLEEA